jgi:ribosomal protein L28
MNGMQKSNSNIKTKHVRKINLFKKHLFNIKNQKWEKHNITARGIRSFYKAIMNKKKIDINI